jgi:iron complex outermembrane receptor protein
MFNKKTIYRRGQVAEVTNRTRRSHPKATEITLSLLMIAACGSGSATDAADTTDSSTDSTSLSEVLVIAKRSDVYNVLPDRQTSSVFGTNMSIAETPRSVTLIESPIISLYGIKTVNDFVNITPGTFTSNYFGIPGSLDVRGERADNFFRGFRRIENNGNFPTSVEAADYVEIIKGPPPVIDGGGKVGGILNFVPKGPTQPNGDLLDTPTALVSGTYGTYDKRQADLEAGTPFSLGSLPSAVYASVQGEDSLSYYDNIYTKNALMQVAAKSVVSDRLSLEYGGMVQWANLNQSLGWNRLTQALISSDGGQYLAGTPALNLDTNHDGMLEPSELAPYQLSQYAFANPFPYYALSPQQRAAYALDPSTVHDASLSHHTVMATTADFARSNVYTAYFDLKYDLGQGWSIANQSFYDRMNHTKYSSYGFTADYHAFAVENKTTVTGELQPSSWSVIDPVAGVTYRRSGGLEREARDTYQVEDRRDLSVGATANDIFEGAYDGTGNVPYNWDQDGYYTDEGAFALLTSTFFKRVTAILGGRLDRYHVSDYGTDDYGVYAPAADSSTAHTYNASLSAKIVPAISLYTSYASSEYLELGQGGIVGRPNIDSRNWIQPSKLAEVGLKGYLDDGRLYFSVDRYDQQKSAYDVLAASFDKYRSRGEELEAHYALTKQFSFIATATWQSTMLLNAPFFNAIPPAALGLDPALIYGGKLYGLGSQIGIDGPLEEPMPNRVFALNGTYSSPQGWGLLLGATQVSSLWAGFTHLVRLPQYTVARAAAFYQRDKWSVQLNVDNLFDKEYFTPQYLFWDVFVSPSMGRTANLTISRKF